MTFVSLFIVQPENLHIFSLLWFLLLLYGTHFYISTGLESLINYSHINKLDNKE
jgi:hypothetical protein